jgi:hypothetical protein
MSRIRSIHPGLWTDEQFVSLSSFARLLFMGIWNECDDKGIFPWSPLQMKMRILPADNVDASTLMAELEAADCIKRYEIDGKCFGAVRNFAKFQRPKMPNNIHPATEEILIFAGHKPTKAPNASEELRKDLPNASEKSPQMERRREEEGDIPLPNGNGAAPASDKVFWDAAVAYLGGKRSLIGKWSKDYGRQQAAEAITAAQLERVVDPVSYIEAVLRKGRKAKSEEWVFNSPA